MIGSLSFPANACALEIDELLARRSGDRSIAETVLVTFPAN